MILTGSEIKKRIADESIVIRPFNPEQITTNSYDFRLGEKLLVNQDSIIDPRVPGNFKEVTIPEDGFVLRPDTLYLGHTVEVMGSTQYVPIIRGKSSTGRMGIYVHITADLIDIGSINQYTLMMHSVQPVRVFAGMLIGQVTFWRPCGDIELYRGKYQGLSGPQASKLSADL